MRKPYASLLLAGFPLLLLAVVAPAPAFAAEKASKAEKADNADDTASCTKATELAERFQDFLTDAALLIGDQERKIFLCLTKDYQRDAFIEQFWRVRDPYPDTAVNELSRRWNERLFEVRQLFGGPSDVRGAFYLLNGAPPLRYVICPQRSRPLEVWFYGFNDFFQVLDTIAKRELHHDQYAVIFFKRGMRAKWEFWSNEDPVDVLYPLGDYTGPPPQACGGDKLDAALQLSALMVQGLGPLGSPLYRFLSDKLAPPKPPSSEWVMTFASYSTDLPADTPTLDATVDITFPGRRQSRTLVQIALDVDLANATALDLLGHKAYAFELIGEVLRKSPDEDIGEVLFEPFRYRFELPVEQVAEGHAPLVAQRYLRPGEYKLVLRIDDLNGDAGFRKEIALDVPNMLGKPAEVSPEVAAAFEQADKALSGTAVEDEATLKILSPFEELTSGYQRFEAVVTGPVAQVAFDLDGKTVLTKNTPPYSVDLDLGKLPRQRRLRATAFDTEGLEIASDEQFINTSPHRFAVRMIDPVSSHRYEGSLRVRADVTVPPTKTLERIEIYRDDTLVATLYQEPWVQPVDLPTDRLTVIRTVGYLTDGTSNEDTVIVNGPPNLEEVQVDYVELYTTVTGADGHPLLDLPQDAFKVEEDGVDQQIVRFEHVQDTPIRGTILLDVSASMEERLGPTIEAAVRFFKQVITKRDELSMITFNDRPYMAANFTNDLGDFARGLAGLRAERGTALYDSLIYTLFNLNGLPGQRVVLLLSDGVDEHSRFTFDDALEYAKRSQAAVYAIGIQLEKKTDKKGPEKNPKKVLEDIAGVTGGRAFFLDSLEQLQSVYDTIAQELRSKVLLTYQSSNNSGGQDFRKVEVKVDRKGAVARTIQGYYP